MYSIPILIAVAGSCVAAWACDYKSGMSFRNLDSVAVEIEYNCPIMTAAICWAAHPDSNVKNGIVSLHDRPSHSDYQLLQSPAMDNGLTAKVRIMPGAVVPCLCVKAGEIRMAGVDTLLAKNGSEVVWERGLIRIRQAAALQVKAP